MRRVKTISAGVVALIAGGALAWEFALAEQVEFAKVATAYGAKKACSCRYLGERPMELCERDFTEDVGLVSFVDTGEGVTASVLGGLVSETARHYPGQGCRLEP